MLVFLRNFLSFCSCTTFFRDRFQFGLTKLYDIKVLLNHANCWNFQSDKRDLDMLVVIKKFVVRSNRLFFYGLMITFVRGKMDHHYSRSTGVGD